VDDAHDDHGGTALRKEERHQESREAKENLNSGDSTQRDCRGPQRRMFRKLPDQKTHTIRIESSTIIAFRMCQITLADRYRKAAPRTICRITMAGRKIARDRKGGRQES